MIQNVGQSEGAGILATVVGLATLLWVLPAYSVRCKMRSTPSGK